MVAAAVLLAVATVLPALTFGHAERRTVYPDTNKGAVPAYRTSGPSLVVCKPDSRARIIRSWKGRSPERVKGRRTALRALARCKYRDIQTAVNHAQSGYRILIEPGLYKEEPSRKVPVDEQKCAGDQYWESSGDQHQKDGRVPTYLHQVDCPNSRNLIAIIGDSLNDPDQECDHLCNLQLEGLGRRARDTVIQGDRLKPDIIRADRADGFQLHDVTVEQGAYNDINVVETNGFYLSKIVARWGSHYGILSFTDDHGLYDHIEAYGNGDSGLYPGSGPEYHCHGYGIEIRNSNSYGNLLGASGTAGNGTWWHDNRLHDNGAGLSQDSFAPGHPGMPQDCSKFENNQIYSNNHNYFERNKAECKQDFAQRRKETVCPVFQVVIGVGFMLYGVNNNTFTGNYIWDQWRDGVRQFGVPAELRGENDPSKQFDTSHGNQYVGNHFGVRPDGTPDRNGTDVYWDEQGLGNCWQDNTTAAGRALTSDPKTLPDCKSGGSTNPQPNWAKLGSEVPCATWNPNNNSDPPGCTWFTTPEDPGD